MRVIMLNTEDRDTWHEELFDTLRKQRGFELTVCNTLRQFSLGMKKHKDAELVFIPATEVGMRVIKKFPKHATAPSLSMYHTKKHPHVFDEAKKLNSHLSRYD